MSFTAPSADPVADMMESDMKVVAEESRVRECGNE